MHSRTAIRFEINVRNSLSSLSLSIALSSSLLDMLLLHHFMQNSIDFSFASSVVTKCATILPSCCMYVWNGNSDEYGWCCLFLLSFFDAFCYYPHILCFFKSSKIYRCELTTFNFFLSFLFFPSESFRLCCAQLQLFGIFREEIHTHTHTFTEQCERQKLWERQNAIEYNSESMSNGMPEWNGQRNLPSSVSAGDTRENRRSKQANERAREEEKIHSHTSSNQNNTVNRENHLERMWRSKWQQHTSSQ